MLKVRYRHGGRGVTILLALLAAFAPLLPLPDSGASAAPDYRQPVFADPAFERVWNRLDHPVYLGEAARSYTWGFSAPGVGARSGGFQEEYQEGKDGLHLVQYFDKSRMEINDPDADPDDPFYVTQGLLARDMIGGEFQVGDTLFAPASQGPAQVPFGDLDDTGAASPTYASFTGNLQATPVPAGQVLASRLARNGAITADPTLAAYGVTSRGVLPGTPPNSQGFSQHAIASVFLDFVQSRGPIYNGMTNEDGALFEPLQYVFGYPITEAYWAIVKAAGTPREVLIQCFERRCLTYAPSNDPAYRVELANTGLQYFDWRYRRGATAPSGSWTAAPSAALAGPVALLPLPGGQLLLLGDDRSSGFPASSQRFDPATNTWSQPVPLTTSRLGYFIATLPSGAVLAIGGLSKGPGGIASSVERYDPATDQWRAVAPISTPRYDAVATTLADGRVLLTGGDPAGVFTGQSTASAEIYDPAQDRWSAAEPMTIPRLRHTATLLKDGRVLVTGGLTPTPGTRSAIYPSGELAETTSAEIYDPQTGHWTAAAPMHSPRSLHTAQALNTGQVLVTSEQPSPALTIERYDVGSNSWSLIAPVPTASGYPETRSGKLTTLADGQVLFVGGRVLVPREQNGPYPNGSGAPISTPVADVARYDPLGNRWIVDAPLPRPLADLVLAPLPDGRILCYDGSAGGFDRGIAFLYTPPTR